MNNRFILKLFDIQFIKFCIVGLANTAISFAVYLCLLKFGVHYLLGSAIGYVVGVLNGYLLSSRYVFKHSLKISVAIKYVITYLGTLGVNLSTMYFLVQILGFGKVISQVLVICLNLLINFFINKFWTFKS